MGSGVRVPSPAPWKVAREKKLKFQLVFAQRIRVGCLMIPKQETLMLPYLRLVRDKELHLQTAVKILGEEFELTLEDLETRYPNGNLMFENNVSWAKTHLKQYGLIFYTKRGYSLATDLGKQVLSENPTEIDRNFLEKFKGRRNFLDRKGTRGHRRKVVQKSTLEFNTPDRTKELAKNDPIEQLDKIKSNLQSKFASKVRGTVVLGGSNPLGVSAFHPIHRLVVISNDLIREAYIKIKENPKSAVSNMQINSSVIAKLVDTMDIDSNLYSRKLQLFENDLNLVRRDSEGNSDQSRKVTSTTEALQNIMRSANIAINEKFSEELIKRVRQLDELEFATSILNLLEAMGYKQPEQQYLEQEQHGATLKIGFKVRPDALGVVEIYVEAVSAPVSHLLDGKDIREFERMIGFHKVTSGIIISTANFDVDAMDAAINSSSKIEVISGSDLARLMIENEIGCRQKEIMRLMEFDIPLRRFG